MTVAHAVQTKNASAAAAKTERPVRCDVGPLASVTIAVGTRCFGGALPFCSGNGVPGKGTHCACDLVYGFVRGLRLTFHSRSGTPNTRRPE